MSYESRTGAVLFANSLAQVATFYSKVLDLSEASRGDDHILLESPGFQLVVHRIPAHSVARQAPEPPTRRAMAAFKPVFFVHSLGSVRTIVSAHGGTMGHETRNGHSTASWFAMRSTQRGTSFSSARWVGNQAVCQG